MGKTDFDKLLERYLNGKATEQERMKLEAWLDTVKTEETGNMELSEEEEQQLFNRITAHIENTKEIMEFKPESLKKNTKQVWIVRIAAALFIVTALTFAVQQFIPNQFKFDSLAQNENLEKRILNDGTLVWMKPESKLTFYVNQIEKSRQVDFQGEALFEVAKDPAQPFIINYEGMSIRVLGTSFMLKTNKDTLELNVLTGKVKLSSAIDKIGVELLPNEAITYTRNGQVERNTTPIDQFNHLMEHTEYNMKFDNERVDNIMKRIEKKFDVKIESDNLNNCKLTADFTDTSLNTTLQMISEVLDITYKKKEGTILVQGNGCMQP